MLDSGDKFIRTFSIMVFLRISNADLMLTRSEFFFAKLCVFFQALKSAEKKTMQTLKEAATIHNIQKARK